jgi:hypothetical protein
MSARGDGNRGAAQYPSMVFETYKYSAFSDGMLEFGDNYRLLPEKLNISAYVVITAVVRQV